MNILWIRYCHINKLISLTDVHYFKQYDNDKGYGVASVYQALIVVHLGSHFQLPTQFQKPDFETRYQAIKTYKDIRNYMYLTMSRLHIVCQYMTLLHM